MSEHRSLGETSRLNDKSTRICKPKSVSSIKTRITNQLAMDKENRPNKDAEVPSNNSVANIRARYEELLKSGSKNFAPSTGDNSRLTGAIKKRVDPSKEKILYAQKSVDVAREKSFGAQKRVDGAGKNGVGLEKRVELASDRKRVKFDGAEGDGFAKSRFKIYADDQVKSNPVSVANLAQDRRLKSLISEPRATSHDRFTPVEFPIPLTPKKVKVQHRNSLRIENGKPDNSTVSVGKYSNFQLPYEHNFIDLELEKDKPLSTLSKGLRKQNITDGQRKIILKFLVRLNAHSFHPSFLLHQTVRIFDAFLDMKLISVEEMQLVALASMWIALKREQIQYRIPSGEEMIAYSKDLYEGREDLLLKCEKEILRSLNFNIVFPDVSTILCYYVTTCKRAQFLRENQVETVYYCGSYMLDLALFDEDLMEKSPVLIAAAAAEAALFFVTDGDKWDPEPWWFQWRAPDAAKRYTDDEIGEVRSALIKRVNESYHRQSDGAIIFKKYCRSRYGKISHYLCNKVRTFLNVD